MFLKQESANKKGLKAFFSTLFIKLKAVL